MNVLSRDFYSKPVYRPISPDQASLVQASYAKIARQSEALADSFCENLFKINPSVQTFFNGNVHSQKVILAGMLNAVIHGLSNPVAIEPIIKQIGNKYLGLMLKKDDYSAASIALVSALEQKLTDDWNGDLRDAWVAVCTWLTMTLKSSEVSSLKVV